jgi:LysR family hydrogen peroxide-inducible transcriptional activator
MAIASELHAGGDIRLLRFHAPEPKREIGLAWRKTSPRKKEFIQFAELLRDVTPRPGKQAPKRREARQHR